MFLVDNVVLAASFIPKPRWVKPEDRPIRLEVHRAAHLNFIAATWLCLNSTNTR